MRIMTLRASHGFLIAILVSLLHFSGDPAGGVTIDTLLISTGEAAGDEFGVPIQSLGDVNDDGFDDFIVGAMLSDAPDTNAGSAYIFFGGPGLNDTPDLILTGEAEDDRFGRALGGAGDLNGDGYNDVVVGAYANDAGGNAAGRAYIYYGGPGLDSIADLMMTGGAAWGQLGCSVTPIGDANADNYDDLLVGELGNDAAGDDVGRAYVYFGGPLVDNTADLILTGEAEGDQFGMTVAFAGDVNGDSISDFMVGAWRYDAGALLHAGRTYVYFGGSGVDNVADVVLTGENAAGNFGLRLAPAGDFNNDGFDDIVIGSPNGVGKVHLYLGGPAMDNVADLILTGSGGGDQFGGAVGSAGDLNRDGFDDFVVASTNGDGSAGDVGQSSIFFGASNLDSIPDLVLEGEASGDGFGNAIGYRSEAGSANLIVGAQYNDAAGDKAGRIYVFRARSNILYVPSEYATIQEAIDSAWEGDTVLVAAGVYTGAGNKEIDFSGKNILLLSASGPDLTTIDCEASAISRARAFDFHSGESALARVEGFTITGGWELRGGGMRIINNSDPTIQNCVFTSNTADEDYDGGGGIYCEYTSPTIRSCTFENNVALSPSVFGGGIFVFLGGDPLIENCIFLGNSAQMGGGISMASGTVRGCYFEGNISNMGGGVRIWGAGRVTGSVFQNNAASLGNGQGGAFWFLPVQDIFVDSCLIVGNSANDKGGVCRVGGNSNGASIFFTECTMFGNTAIADGSAFWITSFNSPGVVALNRTIIAAGGAGDLFVCEDNPIVTLTCCDLYGNAGGVWTSCIAGQAGINGNISADPLFCDPGVDDFSLRWNSPCAAADSCGQVGKFGIGCYEETWYVKPDGSGDAPTIQAALDSSVAGDTVLVAAGTYYEHDIVMKSKVALVGELGADSTIVDAQQLGRVLYCQGTDSATSIDGITLTGGFITVGGAFGGSGAFVESSFVAITNCIVNDNQTEYEGGGLYFGFSTAVIAGCDIRNNSADRNGGGIQSRSSTLSLSDVSFSQNTATLRGGGIGSYSSPITLSHVSFLSNQAEYGGGTWNVDADLDMEYTFFSNNDAADIAGGAYCGNNSPTITNCTFTGNSAGNLGGGLCLWNATPIINSTIISFSVQGAAIGSQDSISAPTLTCSDLYGNAGGDWTTLIADQAGTNGNFSADPHFCDAPGGDVGLHGGSPCIDAPGCGLVGAHGQSCGPTTWIVLSNGSGDAPSIQAAIDSTGPGDTVLVYPGNYYEELLIDSTSPGILVASYRGPDSTSILSPVGKAFGAIISLVESDSTTRISGFRVSGGVDGIRCDGGSPSVTNCIIDSNSSGMRLASGSEARILNNTIADNSIIGVVSDNSNAYLTNNIISGNGVGVHCIGTNLPAEHNDVWGNGTDWSGDCPDPSDLNGNISLNPKFVSNLDRNLHLNSPCIDSGYPADSDPDGSPADIGAYGGKYAVRTSPNRVENFWVVSETDSIHLSWDPVVGASWYVVYRSDTIAFSPDTGTQYATTTDTGHIDIVPNEDVTYSYTVRAVRADSAGGSNPVEQIVDRIVPIDDGLQPARSWSIRFDGYLHGGDFTAGGIGLQGDTLGTIDIAAIPAGSEIKAAFLYWTGDPGMVLDGRPLGSVLIGTEPGFRAFRADVTPFVPGNGTYQVEPKGSVDGVSLVVVYYDNAATDSSSIVILDGLDSSPYRTGIPYTYEYWGAADMLRVGYVLGGGDPGIGFDSYYLNGAPVDFEAADGSDGERWDTDTISIPFPLPAGSQSYPSIGTAAISSQASEPLRWVAFIISGKASPTSVRQEHYQLPTKFYLYPASPNPFNPITTIRFDIPRDGVPTELHIYSSNGRLISTLVNAPMTAGFHSVVWNGTDQDGRDVGSGVYFYRFEAADFLEVRKTVLIR